MSMPSLDNNRSTCLMACLVTRPRARARPCPIVLTARDAVLMTPRVALARDTTRLACMSPSSRLATKRCTCVKQRVWFGCIAGPANCVACGETRQFRARGNRYMTAEQCESGQGHLESFHKVPQTRRIPLLPDTLSVEMRGSKSPYPPRAQGRIGPCCESPELQRVR